MPVRKGSRGSAPFILNFSLRWRRVVNAIPSAASPLGKRPGIHCRGSWVWTRGELSYLAPLGSENISAPYFKQCFFGGGGITPQTESNTTPPSPKTEITNILFYILNLWLQIYCSGLRGCDTREKEIIIWPCWCFMADIIFTPLSLLLCL